MNEKKNLNDRIREIRDTLENATDVTAAMAHRFEYHIFHLGQSHRIGRAAHEDVMDLVGEWCLENAKAIIAGAPKPVYLFMDNVLSSVLEFNSFGYGKIAFKETSFMFGLHDQPVVEEELRVFTR